MKVSYAIKLFKYSSTKCLLGIFSPWLSQKTKCESEIKRAVKSRDDSDVYIRLTACAVREQNALTNIYVLRTEQVKVSFEAAQ